MKCLNNWGWLVDFFLLSMEISAKAMLAQPSWKFSSTVKRYTITELSCYHGAMRSVEAEKKLKQQPGDSHLIRYSDSKGEYILSVLKRGANGPICQHFVIKTKLHEINLYSVEGSDMTFHDVSEMLKYFRKNPINYEINGIGEPCHATPVTTQVSPEQITSGEPCQATPVTTQASPEQITSGEPCQATPVTKQASSMK